MKVINIKTTATTTEEITKDIQLPYFCELGEKKFCVNENAWVTEVHNCMAQNLFATVCSYPISTLEKYIVKATPISESEFSEAFELAIKAIESRLPLTV